MSSAFILIDKPAGITSFKALLAVKKQFGTKRAGHAGTLDMSASGLLVAAVGKCTRLLPYIEAQEKVYSFDLHLGILTDTLEPAGNVLKRDDNAARTPEEVEAVLQTFIGEIEQVPPAFSAIKINGKRASDLALKGNDVELKARSVHIYCLNLDYRIENGEWRIENNYPCTIGNDFVDSRSFYSQFSILNSQLIYHLYCKCSKGTYIRSLARDIAEKLGTCGVAGNIRRLAIGEISVEQASAKPVLPQELLKWNVADIDEEQANKILNGVPIPHTPNPIPHTPVFLSSKEQIIAAAEWQNGYLLPKFQL